ncbi:MAG: hypothetical protein ACI9N9_002244 [Enterobacterales bacterium]|jgi:hypothetical protein
MNSLAVSDGVLLIAMLFIVTRTSSAVALRLGAAVFAAAAFLGVLRFSSVLPLLGMHTFFSGLGASAAFPLIAAAFLWPDALLARSWRFASIFLVIAGALGLVAAALDFSLWGKIVALVSLLALVMRSVLSKNYMALIANTILLLGLILFAKQFSVEPYLQPGDFLHLLMAIGLLLLNYSWREQVLNNSRGLHR